jgi:hypothetical protein
MCCELTDLISVYLVDSHKEMISLSSFLCLHFLSLEYVNISFASLMETKMCFYLFVLLVMQVSVKPVPKKRITELHTGVSAFIPKVMVVCFVPQHNIATS